MTFEVAGYSCVQELQLETGNNSKRELLISVVEVTLIQQRASHRKTRYPSKNCISENARGNKCIQTSTKIRSIKICTNQYSRPGEMQ
jgi:hypothetical protein